MTGLALDPSSARYQYDVFINFRGEDTRHGFTGNLYNALKNAGVDTFFDDEELRGGEVITPALMNAIKNSRTAITVFSKDYASSTFCLKELVKIHQCIKGMGRLVLPIFYDVDPSELRKLTGSYGQALSKHRDDRRADEDTIESWGRALREAAATAGHPFIPGKDGYEYQFIQKIVNIISIEINRVALHVNEHLVGLESRVEKMTSLLQIGSNEKFIMVGVCGIGGLGKTTAARAVYNSVAHNFEASYFLDDVNKGVGIMQRRLYKKKILLVLDNVDSPEQLKKLAGNRQWFGDGSRTIITTRDKQLLVSHGVTSIHDIEALNVKESLALLSWHAFRNHQQVDPSYKDVLKRAVKYAQGLPLALEVIGSHLCGKTINEWKCALDEYKSVPNEVIQRVLKVSYEGLEEPRKKIFLDIACFFNGKKWEDVKYMVEVVHDINDISYSKGVLEDKCLMKIENGRIKMHDLIRDMGREIVREESPTNPGKRSRLWSHQDIVDVLEDKTGTEEVIMIVQDNLYECIEVNWDGEGFKSMTRLKLLIFENVKFSESPKYFPNSLKVLKCKRYPFPSFPPYFSSRKLVVLDVGDSCLSSVETIQNSRNLSVLNLGGCQDVRTIPDLSNLINLKELRLMDCRNLIEIHDSVGYLSKLEILSAHGCVLLETFPRAIRLPSLEGLYLGFCSRLTYFPKILEKMKIREMHLVRSGIKSLPLSICKFPELRHFWICGKSNSVIIDAGNGELEIIDAENGEMRLECNSEKAQQEAVWFNRIRRIYLRGCNISNNFLTNYICRCTSVWELDLTGSNITILPACIKELNSLGSLYLNGCKHLIEVEGIPPSIGDIEAKNCLRLSSESKNLLLLREVIIDFQKLHERAGRFPLQHTMKSCVSSRSIPEWVEHRSKGASISFWFRNSHPPSLILYVLIKSKDAVPGNYYSDSSMDISLEVNGQHVSRGESWGKHPPLNFDDHHLFMYYLMEYRYFGRCIRVLRKNEWNHAKIYARVEKNHIYDDSAIEEIGMCVIRMWEFKKIDDITFTNPCPTLVSTTADQEQSGTSMEEKEVAVNNKRRLVGDDKFASSSTTFRLTKRPRNMPLHQNDNDAIPFAKASESISNNQGQSIEDEKVSLLAFRLGNICL